MNRYCPTCGEWKLVPYCGNWGELDQLYICDHCDQVWTEPSLEAIYTTMKLENKKEIDISKYRYGQPVPAYISFAHRHLEKEVPGCVSTKDEQRFLIPVDLLGLTLPAELVAEIESVELVYRRKG